eukprot:NODE_1869_length_1774_cov_49.430648_g1587_i0.p1 GENE.NODE_1869_length_1774_cov_49.430648_g1587_i0~~NODE_1869_length_1774_cov_49.430648_g1587_i0.p1  ORF type:complete len:561 (-),score=113.38 NODE_1869_length_1774_cov_49.430648_g1587_i0:90-1736(-)
MIISIFTFLILSQTLLACTNFLVTKGASDSGTPLIAYNADDFTLYGALYYWPSGPHPAGSTRKIIDWDTGKYLGEIPEAPYTYNVVGNMNEFQLTIAETTYGGLDILGHQTGAILDYGSLIYITLQRAKTAREAITTLTGLANKYGYASSGETFSIADQNEVWVMDLIGKGEGTLGVVWVAMKIPDGYISGHANQARIRTFPLNDTENCMYAPDVIDFARSKGLYPKDAPDDLFSFSDTFNPISFEGARFCEARVWAGFREVDPSINSYLDYVRGADLKNRMPLWIQPNRKVSLNDTFNWLRNHYEGTWLDFRYDVGAGDGQAPYRLRPLTWQVKGVNYCNERSAGTQQTGFTMVGQIRPGLPTGIGGILWLGVDDANFAVHVPFYSGMTRIPQEYADGDFSAFQFDKAFWVFNLVANFVYPNYYLVEPEVRQKINSYFNKFLADIADLDPKLQQLYKTNPSAAIEMATNYSVSAGSTVVKEWLQFWQYLFVKYMDGSSRYSVAGETKPVVSYPGYTDAWRGRIVAETGDHYRVLSSSRVGSGRARKL